jgi:hypothetical protein
MLAGGRSGGGREMRTSLRILLLAATALMLSGCLASGQLANRGTSIDEGVGTIENRAILLNLARASRAEPLYFVSTGTIQATGATDFRLGVPTITKGHNLTPVQEPIVWAAGSSFLDNTINTYFQMNVYSTHDFYAGLMEPLGLDEIELLLNQGFSRELVFYLVIDKARITPLNGLTLGQSHFVYNDPNDPSYGEFVEFVHQAMDHGLAIELAPTPAGAAAPAQTASSGSDASKKDSAPPAQRQICYEQALATSDAMDDFKMLGSAINFCGRDQAAASSQFVKLKDKKTGQYVDYKIDVIFRSTFGIFKYLGSVMNISDPQKEPVLVDYRGDYPGGVPREETPAGPMFKVVPAGLPGGLLGDCFVAVDYEGQSYCAPRDGDGARTTKQIFNMLNALVALKQSPGDLPATQSVLIP